jgi:hypothetical protein
MEGVLKGVAKQVLPMAGQALGSYFGGASRANAEFIFNFARKVAGQQGVKS